MGLMSAMGSAMTGLRATQDALGIVSSNISNSQTPGYIRRSPTLVESLAGDRGTGVRSETAQRALDTILQRELRTETGGAGFTSVKASYASQLEILYGKPGDAGALDATFNSFTTSLQNLANDPASYVARGVVLDSAAQLASRFTAISKGIQGLRTDAESEITFSVTRANELLQGIASINQQILGKATPDPALLDHRDKQIDELSRLIDVRVSEAGYGAISLSTQNGARLLDSNGAVTLRFDARGSLAPGNLNNPSSALRGVGSITSIDATGQVIDLSGDGSIRSGTLAGYLDVRDNLLVQAQAQLDELAANLASALSDKTIAGQAATSGAATGFAVDLTALQKGNVITLDVVQGGTPRRVSFIRVDDPTQLPLSNQVTADPSDQVFGIDFSAGMASVVTQMQAALGSGFTVANPAGSSIQIVDDGAAGTTDVSALSAKVTTSALAAGDPELALFTDLKTGQPFTNALEGGPQKLGLSQRLVVNPAVILDRSSLSVYGPSIPQGDATRPALLLDRLTKASYTFDPGTGIGTASFPFKGTVGNYTRQVVAEQGANAAAAQRLDEGQQMVLSSIQSRFAETSGVNIDQEMANLVRLQSAYAANARLVSAVKDMMDLLLRM
jgi:flagellar hook-associated protein 1